MNAAARGTFAAIAAHEDLTACAERVGISMNTVRYHLKTAYARTGVSNARIAEGRAPFPRLVCEAQLTRTGVAPFSDYQAAALMTAGKLVCLPNRSV